VPCAVHFDPLNHSVGEACRPGKLLDALTWWLSREIKPLRGKYSPLSAFDQQKVATP
jgi:hypothetical protein